MSKEIVESVFATVREVMVDHRQYGTCLLSSAIIADILNQKGIKVDVIDGFLNFKKSKQYVYHVWIEYNGKEYDAELEISRKLADKNIDYKNIKRTKEPVEGYTRSMSDDDLEMLQFSVNSFKELNAIDWDDLSTDIKVMAYKCYEGCWTTAPFEKPNEHHHLWVNDQFTRMMLHSVIGYVKGLDHKIFPFCALLCHEVLETHGIESTIIRDPESNAVYLKIGNLTVSTNELACDNIAEYKEYLPETFRDMHESILHEFGKK